MDNNIGKLTTKRENKEKKKEYRKKCGLNLPCTPQIKSSAGVIQT